MWTGAADHGDDQGRARQPVGLEFDLLGRRARMGRAEGRGNRRAGGAARFAGKDDETPGRELAVVRHARGDGEEGFDFGGRRAGPAHFNRLDRAAGFEKF